MILTFEDRRITDDICLSDVRPDINSWNLQIRDVQFSDGGEYKCQVSTFPVTRRSVFLAVHASDVARQIWNNQL